MASGGVAAATDLTGEVSNARAQVLDLTIAGEELPDEVSVLLSPAVATNDGGETVVDVGSLDLGPLAELGLDLGPVSLLGDNGILVLGALNQYAEAAGDGSSYAAAGAVSNAGLIEIPDDATPGESGASITISTEALGLGDEVALHVETEAIASIATWPAGHEPDGEYVVADLEVRVGGSLIEQDVADAVDQIEAATAPVADSLGLLGGLLGVDTDIEVESPLDDGALVISLEELLETLGVESINDLEPGTDLLQHLLEAIIAVLTATVDDVVDQVGQAVEDLQSSPQFSTICTPPLLPPNPACGVLGTAVDTVAATLGDVLDTVLATVAGPLGDALSDLLALPVGTETVDEAGSFTKTALSAVIGPDGTVGQIDLANSTVGPNGGSQDGEPDDPGEPTDPIDPGDLD
jgi:hypothetical protein